MLAAATLLAPVQPATASALPSKSQWVADTNRAMSGSIGYLQHRIARGGSRLAVNLDIDNTSLATYYQRGAAVEATLKFATYAHEHGVAVLFNTGRVHSKVAPALSMLRAAGYPVDGICWRRSRGETLAHSKQRCRRAFVAQGYRIIADVGNNRTDFVGGNYERAFRLPSYGGRLS